jgi:hypothetical protein
MFHSGELSSIKPESIWLDDGTSANTLMDVKDVHEHLDMPLQQVVEEAKKLSNDDLDSSNIKLKNYVQSLSNLKAELTKQMQEIQDTAMYATLGITSTTTDSQIKNAYRNLARKLHPDRGGDKEKFQHLQSAYQEILKKRRLDGAGGLDEAVLAEGLSETANAAQLMNELAEMLNTVKVAAEQCAMLAQLCIQGQKMMEASLKEPDALATIHALLSDGTSLGRISQQVIEPLETGCEYMQSIAAKAMALPTLGVKFANATAIVGGFTRTVERSMAAGLESLRTVTDVMSADLQLSVCRQKVSRMHSDYESVDRSSESALLEASLKSFKNVCVAMCTAADKAVQAAEKSAELIDLVVVIMSRSEVEAVADRRRQAERAEKEDHRDPNDVGSENKTPETPEPKEEAIKEEDEEEGGDVVDNLMRKVKALQLQLRVQNVQTLQSLNSSAVDMQTQLHLQLASIDLRAGLAPGTYETHLDSILTLIAEIVDGSCNAIHLEAEAGLILDEDSWRVCVSRQLGWMRLQTRLKIALLPDLRSRTLWFCALADVEALRAIVVGELPIRLCDCVRRAHTKCPWAVVMNDSEAPHANGSAGLTSKFVQGKKVLLVPHVAEIASSFCQDIMVSLTLLMQK